MGSLPIHIKGMPPIKHKKELISGECLDECPKNTKLWKGFCKSKFIVKKSKKKDILRILRGIQYQKPRKLNYNDRYVSFLNCECLLIIYISYNMNCV